MIAYDLKQYNTQKYYHHHTLTILLKLNLIKNLLTLCLTIIGCVIPTTIFAKNYLIIQTIPIHIQNKHIQLLEHINYFNKNTITYTIQYQIPTFILKKKFSNFNKIYIKKIKTNPIYKNLNAYIKYATKYHKQTNYTFFDSTILLKNYHPIQINHQLTINFIQKLLQYKINFVDIFLKKYALLNINNQKKLLKLYTTLSSQYHHIEQQTKNVINTQKIQLNKKHLLPKSIQNQININNNLTIILSQQKRHINTIKLKNQKTNTYILQAQQTLINLIEQTKWLNKSIILKEILRAQIAKLPDIPNIQKIDNDIHQLQKKHFQYEYKIKKLPFILSQSTQDNGTPLTPTNKHFLNEQLTIKRNLITSLLNNYDIQIFELIKLKASNEELNNILQKIQKIMYYHLFWVADTHPITTSYISDVYQDLRKLFTDYKFKKHIISILKIICYDSKISILITLSAVISLTLYIIIRYHYNNFLERSKKYIEKINQDNFLITFYNVCYTMIIALPIPVLLLIIEHILNHTWTDSTAIFIKHGISSIAYISWIFITSIYFASPNGLFITHFGWPKKRIQQFFSYHYIISVNTIILLIMALTIFNNYNKQEFYPTLGRLCFICLCIFLSYITNNLKNSKLPLYINKHNSSNNMINYFLWKIVILSPIAAIFACTFGYFFIAQELLIRLEMSLFIWILLLIIYHLMKRWISIQKRRIAFEHAKQKKIQELTLKNNKKPNITQSHSPIKKKITSNKNNTKTIDLDTINTQSLQLTRSIITLIAILLITLLWSDLHSTFSFLDNITLWDVTSTIQGVNNVQPITLRSFLIAIVVIIITTKTIHNLPAFLELTLLQHFNLIPGTRYAITTLTKYILILLGSIIGCSLIGIEWSKIQWLIAALGVGLGFGLQEIFANFISGLMILFEKPMRIGDTITIHNSTGSVTKINTRATTITDWDHKEIIIPNKEFITKKFINWSLSDTITRVVLKIPGPIQINAKKMTKILLQIIKNSPLLLNSPPPEVYLSDLQQGFPIFEIRMYVADTKLRMPLCHEIHLLIMEYYQQNGIKLPHLPNHIYKHQFTITDQSSPPIY